MELRVGIYGECAEDFAEGERLLRDFYRSEGIFVPILRFTSVHQLETYYNELTRKPEVFFPLLAWRKYLSSLLPLVERLAGEADDSDDRESTLEIILADPPCPADFCQKNRERFLPPASLWLPAKDIPREFIPERILYIETKNRNVLVHTEKETVEILMTITAMSEKLKDNPLFARPHVSFLVNLAWIKQVEGYNIVLKNGEIIPLSQKRSAVFRDIFHKYLSYLLKKPYLL
jgi:hypothetical protein